MTKSEYQTVLIPGDVFDYNNDNKAISAFDKIVNTFIRQGWQPTSGLLEIKHQTLDSQGYEQLITAWGISMIRTKGVANDQSI